ncbi:MAG: AAA family ATPase [Bacteroides sp.]|nr:AAA family ATPase [Roseburia sp.]MCM1345620.1 AAA family ATPase [Bacteroides sp.]MCM1421943.1 AAA family ATPase [Bacteroides sp.]
MEKVEFNSKFIAFSHADSQKDITRNAVEEQDDRNTDNEAEGDEFDRLIEDFLAETSDEKPRDAESDDNADRPLEEFNETSTEDQLIPAEERLENLIGLPRLKSDIADAKTMALFTKQRKALGLDTTSDNRHHMLFLGNPGTGKTTVAKLVGEMYHDMGLLSVGHTIETSRSKLVGEFIGQTEKNTNEAINEARGGVLFIDEAYTLINSTNSNQSNDFGKEVINSLLVALSDPNPDMIIILAGYEEKMQLLLSTNPGLKDRFPLKFYFEDYTKDELKEIAHVFCRDRNFKLTPAADRQLSVLIEKTLRNKDEHFGNGRWVHNLIEHGIIKSMAKRVMGTPHIQDDCNVFCLIEESDVIEAEQRISQHGTMKLMSPMRIGFTA